jgi:hypothetical protein
VLRLHSLFRSWKPESVTEPNPWNESLLPAPHIANSSYVVIDPAPISRGIR